MIRTKSLCKTFTGAGGGEVLALDRVDLRVERGEFLAVVGPSGSGKSSLLFALGALAAPTSGEVWLGEQQIYELGPSERAALRREQVGFVFQTFNLVPYLTCEENVALPALLAGRPRAEAFAAAREVLGRLGLSPRRRHRPAELSVGERQRAGVGRALVNGPSLLLADEPTGNLDPAATADVMGLFREIHAAGRTVVMVTHDPALAEVADRVVCLRAGAVVEDRFAGAGRKAW
jgi:putative ABC transport system ATP-binding protein